jgi:chaperone required for assembly of F1-ATPase
MSGATRKRFYKEASVSERDGLFGLTLDGRTARTPGKAAVALSSLAVMQAVANEWAAQGDVLSPDTMPLTRLVNSAIDGVAGLMGEVAAEIVRYAGSDMVCYRAAEPDNLVTLQEQAWNPVLDWAGNSLGVQFVLSEGIRHVMQPPTAIGAVRQRVAHFQEPLALAALNLVTSLTGSALIALMLADGAISHDEAWAAAHVDEFFQADIWGEDEEALERRARRRIDFDAATYALSLVLGRPEMR